jgi:hypothetical protein
VTLNRPALGQQRFVSTVGSEFPPPAPPEERPSCGLVYSISDSGPGEFDRLVQVIRSLAGTSTPMPLSESEIADAERMLAEALITAGVPTDRSGVFITLDSRAGVESPEGKQLDTLASLAVLGRRSGPLYLPSRPLQLSLIEPADFVLVFP